MPPPPSPSSRSPPAKPVPTHPRYNQRETMNSSLLDTAQQVVRLGLNSGAHEVECTISEGDEFSVSVRMHEVETIKDAGSRGAGVRVLIGKRVGSSYTSDLSQEGLQRMIASAVELAGLTSEDPHAGMPEPSELGSIDTDLQLYSDDVGAIETSE